MIIVYAECFVGLATEPIVVKHQLSAYQFLEVDVPDVKLKEIKNLDVDKCVERMRTNTS